MRTRLIARSLVEPPSPGWFDLTEIAGLDEPVRRFFSTAIAPGTPLARSARFRMRGTIKVGDRWLRFRSWQVESPHRGFVWAARAGSLIVGSDRYVDRVGRMDWRVLGLLRVAHAEGPDVTRSAAGRAGAGWHYGTDRWPEGEFFRSPITDYRLLTTP